MATITALKSNLKIEGAFLDKEILQGASIDNLEVYNSTILVGYYSSCRFNNCCFSSCIFTNCHVTKCHFLNCSFTRSTLTANFLSNNYFSYCNINSLHLNTENTNCLLNSNFQECSFKNINLDNLKVITNCSINYSIFNNIYIFSNEGAIKDNNRFTNCKYIYSSYLELLIGVNNLKSNTEKST